MYNYKNYAGKFPARAQDEKKKIDNGTKSTDSKNRKKAINSRYPPTTTNHSFCAS